jgi:hypothetical protein
MDIDASAPIFMLAAGRELTYQVTAEKWGSVVPFFDSEIRLWYLTCMLRRYEIWWPKERMTRLGYVPSDAPVDGIGEERHVEEDDPYLESDEEEVSDGRLMRIRLVMGG